MRSSCDVATGAGTARNSGHILAPPGSEGAAAGLQDISRGVGVVLGPIAVGATIDAFNNQFSSTHGYAAMWPVIGIPVLASFLILRKLQPHGEAAYAVRPSSLLPGDASRTAR